MSDITVIEVQIPGEQGPPGEVGPVGRDTVAGTTFTPALLDSDLEKKFTSATPVTVTLPADFSGDEIPDRFRLLWAQRGVGQITFVEGAGVNPILTRFAKKSAGQYAVGVVFWDAIAEEWWLVGDTADA